MTKKRMEKRKKRVDRVYKGDFENVELAHFAKSCVWMAICIDNMYPLESKQTWNLFTRELQKLVRDGTAGDMVESLKKLSSEERERQKLVKFVGSSCNLLFLEIIWRMLDELCCSHSVLRHSFCCANTCCSVL